SLAAPKTTADRGCGWPNTCGLAGLTLREAVVRLPASGASRKYFDADGQLPAKVVCSWHDAEVSGLSALFRSTTVTGPHGYCRGPTMAQAGSEKGHQARI